MAALALDTLSIARRLKEAGYTEPQAEAVAEVLRETQKEAREDLATKADLQLLRQELKGDFDTKLADLRAELFRWGLTALLAQTAAIAALVRLL